MTTRKDNLKNVAFGGDWSERFQETGSAEDVLRILECAVDECADRDVRGKELEVALSFVRAKCDKGDIYRAAFLKALQFEAQEQRRAEVFKVFERIKLWLGR